MQFPLWQDLPIVRGGSRRRGGRPPKIRAPIECRECHRMFIPDRRRSRGYCSPKCGKAAHHRLHRLTKDKPCANCQKSLRNAPAATKFCSSECAEAARTAICAFCRQPFIRYGGKFCSRRCADVAKIRFNTCKNCGDPFRPHRGRSEQPFCSPGCYWEKRTGRPRPSAAARRSIATPLPNISTRLRAVIAAREGYRCWLCERKIDRRLKHPHPRSLSLDHYIPVTKGGSDDPNNLRPAHLICNVRRAAAPPTKSFQLDLDLRPMRAPVIRNARQRRRAMGLVL
jgi:hypothetical protein